MSSRTSSDEDFSLGSDEEFVPEVETASDEECDSSESESESEETSAYPADSDPLFVSKNNMIWSSTPLNPSVAQTRSENIIAMKPGVTRYAISRVEVLIDSFLLFFPTQIEKIIIENTNNFGRSKFGDKKHKEMDKSMLHAYFGVLILAGVYKSKTERIEDLFDANFGRPIFRAIMSKETFQCITKVLRFDDPTNRRQNRLTYKDKFAPIRNLWDKWVELLPLFYNPSSCVTVDEQLLGFHGRCSFRQYMPSKPEKYGLKFWVCTCAETSYIWDIQPYLGKEIGATAERNQGERVVLDLVEGLKGHNITMDNFFTSYELGQKLLQKNLTMVGTVRKNKRSIPPKLLLEKKQPLFQSTFAFTDTTTLVSYISKKNKCTVVQSTMHNNSDVGPEPKKMPEIIQYYNKTKGGVDNADKMLSGFSSKRKTNRWPMCVFSNIVDISALNAFIVYMQIDPGYQTSRGKQSRKKFLHDLGVELGKDYMFSRSRAPRATCSLSLQSMLSCSSTSIMNDTGIEDTNRPVKRTRCVSPPPKKRGRCAICLDEKAKTKENKTELICCLCRKNVCKTKHNRNVCAKCFENV